MFGDKKIFSGKEVIKVELWAIIFSLITCNNLEGKWKAKDQCIMMTPP